MVNKERVELFAAALESGNYEQCTGRLWRHDLKVVPSGTAYQTTTFCALGVATEVALQNGLQMEEDTDPWFGSSLHPKVARWYGWTIEGYGPTLDPVIRRDDGYSDSIAAFNDDGTSFWDLAQMIRREWLKDEG
jgi:hypothetical protein